MHNIIMNLANLKMNKFHSDSVTKRGVAITADDSELDATNTTLINFFKTSSALPTDKNVHVCRAESALGSVQEAIGLTVQGIQFDFTTATIK